MLSSGKIPLYEPDSCARKKKSSTAFLDNIRSGLYQHSKLYKISAVFGGDFGRQTPHWMQTRAKQGLVISRCTPGLLSHAGLRFESHFPVS